MVNIWNRSKFSTQSFSYTIYSIAGALIQQGSSADGLVNVASLTNGSYLIQLGGDPESTTFFFQKD